MIQRIQSVWLLLAALINAGLFYFALYKSDILIDGVATEQLLRVNNDFLSVLIALLITVLPLIAIFLYKNRSRQRTLVLISMFLNIGFIAYMLYRVSGLNEGTSAPANGTYWIGAILPVLSTIFLFMALSGIRKDQKLVKSVDRLR